VVIAYNVRACRVTALWNGDLTALESKAWVYVLVCPSLPVYCVSFSFSDTILRRMYTIYRNGMFVCR